jgi:putative transposase
MRQATSPSTGIRYGLARVCRVWGMARSTVYWRRRESRATGRRPGPLGACTDKDLVGQIRTVLQASPFHGEGYRKVWARLRDAGVHTSPRRVLRLMREQRLLAPQRQGQPRGPKAHDGTITTDRIDTMWGTDMTTTFTREDGQVAMFIAVDHGSAECVGIHAATHGTRFEALEPIRQGVRTHMGAFGKDVAHGLTLRHDHGSQ